MCGAVGAVPSHGRVRPRRTRATVSSGCAGCCGFFSYAHERSNCSRCIAVVVAAACTATAAAKGGRGRRFMSSTRFASCFLQCRYCCHCSSNILGRIFRYRSCYFLFLCCRRRCCCCYCCCIGCAAYLSRRIDFFSCHDPRSPGHISALCSRCTDDVAEVWPHACARRCCHRWCCCWSHFCFGQRAQQASAYECCICGCRFVARK